MCRLGWSRSRRGISFALQDPSYRESVLPSGVPKVAIEAGSTFGWERYVDSAIGIDHFGASAPGDVVLEEFGITAEALVERAKTVISSAKVTAKPTRGSSVEEAR